jgi:hypothetical protein
MGEFGINGIGAGDYGSMNVASEGSANAEEETSYEKERTDRTG